MRRTRIACFVGLGSYLLLLFLMLIWSIWLPPPIDLPRSIAIILMVGPLMLPLRGLLNNRPYTFAWSGFIAIIYMVHGMVEAYSNPAVRSLALLELLLGITMFFGVAFHARWRSMDSIMAIEREKTN